jgi:transposase
VIRNLMTDYEWAVVAPFLSTPSTQGGRPPADHRRVLDAVLWINRTGAPWRDLPEVFGNWNSVWRQFRRWCLSGVWDIVLQALADGGGKLDALQMIDSTTSRAHRCAAGEKGGSRRRRSVARAAGSPPRSTYVATR